MFTERERFYYEFIAPKFESANKVLRQEAEKTQKNQQQQDDEEQQQEVTEQTVETNSQPEQLLTPQSPVAERKMMFGCY